MSAGWCVGTFCAGLIFFKMWVWKQTIIHHCFKLKMLRSTLGFTVIIYI